MIKHISHLFVIISWLLPIKLLAEPDLWITENSQSVFFSSNIFGSDTSFSAIENDTLVSPRGNFAFSTSANSIGFWSGYSKITESTIPLTSTSVTDQIQLNEGTEKFVYDKNGNLFYIQSSGTELYVYTTEDQFIQIAQRYSDAFVSLTVSCDNLYAYGTDGVITQYSLETFTAKETINPGGGTKELFYTNGAIYLLDRVSGTLQYFLESDLQDVILATPSGIPNNSKFQLLTGYQVNSNEILLFTTSSIINSNAYNKVSKLSLNPATMNVLWTEYEGSYSGERIVHMSIKAPLDCSTGGSEPECSDSTDNDSDGLIDYPQDPGCSSNLDTSEYNENIDDYCPDDPDKTTPGNCGCGVPEDPSDTDNDGKLDCVDNCPNDASKIEPQSCGCGTPETDNDNDGTPNCNDSCPYNSNRTDASLQCCSEDELNSNNTETCACGANYYDDFTDTCSTSVALNDSDHDGIPNVVDICPEDSFKSTNTGECGCGIYEVGSKCVSVIPFSTKLQLPSPYLQAELDGTTANLSIELAEVGLPTDFQDIKRTVLAAKKKTKSKIKYKYKLYSEVTIEVLEASGGKINTVSKKIMKVNNKKNSITYSKKLDNPGSTLIRVKERKLLDVNKIVKKSGSTSSSSKTYRTGYSNAVIKRPTSLAGR